MVKTEREFLDDLWRDVSGLPPIPSPRIVPDLDSLKETEWDSEFEKLMRN